MPFAKGSSRGSMGIKWLRRLPFASQVLAPSPPLDALPNRLSDTSGDFGVPIIPPELPCTLGESYWPPPPASLRLLLFMHHIHKNTPTTASAAMTPTAIPTAAPVARPLLDTLDSASAGGEPDPVDEGTAVTVLTVPPTVTVWTIGSLLVDCE